jgi:protein-S-isoprenylcysteine O-methyltransferase Ste14
MSRAAAFLYGILAYVMFLGAILYSIGFVENLPLLPKTIDSGEPGPMGASIAVNLVLLGIFAVQHSLMARKGFKAWWTKLVPPAIERSTYVLFANLALILLLWQWRPITAPVWAVENSALAVALIALSLIGWCMVFLSTFLINHFDLFGLSQVWHNMRQQRIEDPQFRTPLLYKFVRHPLYLGFIIAFWAAPVMSMGHLLFAVGTTVYILGAIVLEERDMVAVFGQTYRNYQARVSMILPLPPKG